MREQVAPLRNYHIWGLLDDCSDISFLSLEV